MLALRARLGALSEQRRLHGRVAAVRGVLAVRPRKKFRPSYRQWPPAGRGGMNIYYFVHVTGADLGISGIPRVVKIWARVVLAKQSEPRACLLERKIGVIVHAEQKLLDNFARHGGPKLQQSSQARQPIASERGEWLLFAEAPHLHSHDHEYPSISIDEPIGYARRFGLKVAALIHDLLPLTHQNGRAGRRLFVDMAADGGRSDGSELERLRFTVYAHALALCGRCHANRIWPREDWKSQLRFRPRWRLATSGTLPLGGRGACGGM